jgi:hypothetical protein
MRTRAKSGCALEKAAVVAILASGVATACSLPPRRGGTTPISAAPVPPPAKPELKFPNQELAAMYAAAKASPQSFEPVYGYVKSLGEFCQAQLVDANCGAFCAGGRVRYRPASTLAPELIALVRDALPKMDALMTVATISWDQMAQWVAAKGRLLGLDGRAAEEKALIDDYALQHPEAMPVVKRRLELLREAQDAKEFEAQCRQSRQTLKGATEAVRVELLAACVALHPENGSGREDPRDVGKYLRQPAPDERRLYRRYLTRRCEQDAGAHEANCSRICACDERPRDAKLTANCRTACRGCRAEAGAKAKACKKLRRR